MTIRTRASVDAVLPVFLSPRAWSGFRSWFVSVLCTSGVFALLSAFAWHDMNSRLPDLTAALIAFPAATFALLIFVAAIWTVLARIPFEAGLAFLARLLPFTWLLPIADLLRTGGRGFVLEKTPLDGVGYLLASVTGSLLPVDVNIPAGMRIGIFIIALIAGFVVWFACQDIVRATIAGVVTSAATVKFVLMPSAIGVWNALMHGRGPVVGADETAREALIAITNGYWWTNLYERFPTAVEAQADIALRLTSAGLIVFGLGIMLTALFVWRVSAWRRVLMHTFRAWSAFDLALYTVGGALFAATFSLVPKATGTWWYALPLALLLLAAFRLHAVLERCLHRLSDDERTGSQQPVACGDVAPALAADISFIAWLYSLAAAWALGWPVFAMMLISVVASSLSRDRAWSAWPWTASVFRATGSASLALAGVFFVAQNARLTPLAAAVALLAACHRLVIERLWQGRNT